MADGFDKSGVGSPGGRPQLRVVGEACPFGLCDGSGRILHDDNSSTYCECRAQRLAKKRMQGVDSALPKRFRGVSFDRPPISDIANGPGRVVVKVARDYIAQIGQRLDEGRGLWFEGGVGTGKTSLAMLVSREAINANHTVAIYSTPRLLARIRRTYDAQAGEDNYLDFFDRLTSVDLLHLDDLGAENRTDWVLEQLYAIVDERYQSQRAMVVTTNLDHDALAEQIGERTVSRLVEICGDPLRLDGGDMRYETGPGGALLP